MRELDDAAGVHLVAGPRRRLLVTVDVAIAGALGVVLSLGVSTLTWHGCLPVPVVFVAIRLFAGAFVLRRFTPLAAMVATSVLPPLMATPWFLAVWMLAVLVAYGAQARSRRVAALGPGGSLLGELSSCLVMQELSGRPMIGFRIVIVQFAAWVSGWAAARGRVHNEGLPPGPDARGHTHPVRTNAQGALVTPKPDPSSFDQTALTWRKSTHSGDSGNCPEFARWGSHVLLRDDADLGKPPSVWTVDEIRALFAGIKDGEFDDLTSP
ncbi:DUF397 domain-containing protein [Embleya sp. NPDC008237]|uniref:DUF397 domain-containing protein n=1 Tax=Embleya sp. NPDC008237 TaxID=3363978 RepID=UPI0036ED819C